MSRSACFLDRHDLERALAVDRSAVAADLDRLRAAGFAVVAASNEPTVAAGARTERDVQEADRLLAATLVERGSSSPIDRFYWCPFSPDAAVDRYRFDHPWRKPRPGMLLQAAQDLDLDLARSWMLAGRPEDLAAARAAGTRVAALRAIGDDPGEVDLTAAVEAVLTASEAEPRSAPGTRIENEVEVPEVEVLQADSSDATFAAVPADAAEPFSNRADSPTRPGPDAGAVSTSPPRRDTRTNPGAPARASAPIRIDEASSKRVRPRIDPLPAPGPAHVPERSTAGDEKLLGAIRELTEELRQTRAGARELSGGRVVALLLELGVLLAAAMGLLQVAEPMLFAKWFLGAMLLQLAAIAMLLFDRR